MSEADAKPVVGIIGGSGLYEIEGLTDVRWQSVASPFGEPSDQLCRARLEGQEIVFLPRHGRGHRIPPSDVNYRANIDALKRSGVNVVIAFGAVGSLKEELAPGSFVIIDQYIDRTVNREKSFFGPGLVAHVGLGHPVSAWLADLLETGCRSLDIPVCRDGTYLCMEGPQFSTLAESELYRSWGCDVIGMTGMPEAKLIREAEMSYAAVCTVTDYDCWHPDHDHVTVEAILKTLFENADKARALIREVVPRVAQDPGFSVDPARTALDTAIVTAREVRDAALMARLDAIAGRVMNSKGET
ncbi:MAG: S-methyl-5'-thioadenosine phosphorylase [Alphaproteobacteria bacterium]|nr:S-methyl-5'-thioadenosine phosphorylase [Alphaproteobacteria bacterium]